MVYSRISALKTPENVSILPGITSPTGVKEEIFTGGAARFWSFETKVNKRQQRSTNVNTALHIITMFHLTRQQNITHNYTCQHRSTLVNKRQQNIAYREYSKAKCGGQRQGQRMTQPTLATLAPTKKAAIVRSRFTEICEAYARGCSYEQIAKALFEETGVSMSRRELSAYVDREKKKRKLQPEAVNTKELETKSPIEPSREQENVVKESSSTPVETGQPLTFDDVSKLMRTQVDLEQYYRKRKK